MANLAGELGSLNFEALIGGPLQAAVKAQTSAAMSTVDFIKTVGLEEDTTSSPSTFKVRYVEFNFDRNTPNPDYDSNDPSSEEYLTESVDMKVPLLTIVPIPALQIDEVRIGFNCKLTSVQTEEISQKISASASLGVKFSVVDFKASFSYQRTTTRGTKVEKTYSMSVDVLATQAEVSPGLETVLGIFENSIVGSQKPKTN